MATIKTSRSADSRVGYLQRESQHHPIDIEQALYSFNLACQITCVMSCFAVITNSYWSTWPMARYLILLKVTDKTF